MCAELEEEDCFQNAKKEVFAKGEQTELLEDQMALVLRLRQKELQC